MTSLLRTSYLTLTTSTTVRLHFSTFLPVIFDNVVWNWYLKPHVNQLNETHEFSPSAACVVSILYWRRSFSRLKLDLLGKTDGGQSYIESQRVLIYDKFPTLVVFVVSTRSVSAAAGRKTTVGRSKRLSENRCQERGGQHEKSGCHFFLWNTAAASRMEKNRWNFCSPFGKCYHFGSTK